MRLPNGYGSVIDLGKKRRKRYAVRITNGRKKNSKDQIVQTYKYLGYFEKSVAAYEFLAKYNSGQVVAEHIKYTEQPTFAEVYEEWLDHVTNKNSSPKESSLRNYKLAFNMCSDIHNMKMINIKVSDLEEIVGKYKEKSKSTVLLIKTLFKKLYKHSLKHKYVQEDITSLVDYEWSEEKTIERKEFTQDEIDMLWNNIDKPNVDIILMMIYTGFRTSEFLGIENKNVNIKERYIIGGIKTNAGTNRTVPISKKILPLIEKYYSKENKYLISNPSKKKYSYPWFHAYLWTPAMSEYHLEHTPHDTRHTLASLLDRAGANKICTKLILGHSIADVTDGTYTHKNLDDLIETIDLI